VSIRLHVDRGLADAALEHLRRPGEQVGFFLADTTAGGAFALQAWRPIVEDELVPSMHAVLSDEASSEVIRWAFTAQKALVEIHTHGAFAPAAFSTIDIAGFGTWVPGVRWRLRGAPYAAAVIAADTVDAWAWLGRTSDRPEQVDAIVIDGTEIVPTTRATMERADDDT
jgi:hypothetical protein